MQQHTYEAIEFSLSLSLSLSSSLLFSFFLCLLDRYAGEQDEETEKREGTVDTVSFISRGPLCRTRSLECRFLRVFVSEARNSACPSQLRSSSVAATLVPQRKQPAGSFKLRGAI